MTWNMNPFRVADKAVPERKTGAERLIGDDKLRVVKKGSVYFIEEYKEEVLEDSLGVKTQVGRWSIVAVLDSDELRGRPNAYRDTPLKLLVTRLFQLLENS